MRYFGVNGMAKVRRTNNVAKHVEKHVLANCKMQKHTSPFLVMRFTIANRQYKGSMKIQSLWRILDEHSATGKAEVAWNDFYWWETEEGEPCVEKYHLIAISHLDTSFIDGVYPPVKWKPAKLSRHIIEKSFERAQWWDEPFSKTVLEHIRMNKWWRENNG